VVGMCGLLVGRERMRVVLDLWGRGPGGDACYWSNDLGFDGDRGLDVVMGFLTQSGTGSGATVGRWGNAPDAP